MNWTNQQTKRNKGISCNPGTDKNWNLWNDMAWLLVSFPERKEPQKSATELKKRLSSEANSDVDDGRTRTRTRNTTTNG